MPTSRGLSRWWIAAVLAVAFSAPAAAHAATITVTTTTDEVANDGACSLREAISAIDSPPGAGDCTAADGGTNVIVLPAGRYHLTIQGAHEDANATGDLDVRGATSGLTIQGAGAGVTTIDATGLGDRVLDIAVGAPSVALTGLTITGGHAPDGTPGAFGNGANGGNGTAGEAGGAIRANASLSLTDSAVLANQAGAGGTGGSSIPGFLSGNGAPGGSGGGIATTAALTLVRTSVSDNRAGAGGAGASGGASNAGGAGAVGGAGGGIATSADLTVTDSTISGNNAGDDGAGGDGGPDPGSGHGGKGGPGGSGSADGGGIELLGGSATITGSTISGNSAGDGGKGGNGGPCSGPSTFGGNGGDGGFGSWGGAINAASAHVTLTNSTLAGNFAGNGGAGGAGGSGGFGAGMTGGTGGNGGSGHPGGNGGGFALAGGFETGSFLNVTDAQNGIGAGGAAGAAGAAGDGTAGSPGSAAAAGTGGGVHTMAPDATSLENTIVASNGGSNCSGSVEDGGGDIVFGDSTCPGVTGDPKLSDLRDNGGLTETMALLPGSAALDRIPASGGGCPPTDQRGITRPQPAGGMCDAGAYEFTPPSCAPVTASGQSAQPTSVQLSCADPAGAALTYAIDAPPAHGTLGSINQATGTVTYTSAPGYTGADSFTYHAASNNGTAANVTATLTITPAPRGVVASITKLRLSPSKFRSAARGGSVARKRTGTNVTFALNVAATVHFTISRPMSGKRGAKGRCVAPNKAKRHARRCTRWVKLRGSFTRAGKAGTNRFRFTGRLSRRSLRPGRYRLVATPPKPGRSRGTAFRIVR